MFSAPRFAARSALALVAAVVGTARGVEQDCQAVAAAGCTGPRNVREFTEQFIQSASYYREEPPNWACGINEPVKVEAQFYVTYIGVVQQVLGQVTLGGYLRQWWRDPRLAFNSTWDGGCLDEVVLPSTFRPADHIWTPNLYIDNSVVWIQDGARLTTIDPDGGVFTSDESRITVNLDMRFDRMPFDSHTVFLELASYSMPSTTVRLMARGGTAGAGTSGTGMESVSMTHAVWLIEDGDSLEGFSTPGSVTVKEFHKPWDYLKLSFKISRKPKFLVDQILLQDLMFLGVCYAGFFVNPTVAPARAAMAVIPVLIMRMLANAVFSELPQLSYSVWIAEYLQASMVLCVACVIQFAVTQYCLLQEARGTRRFNKLKDMEKEVKTAFGAVSMSAKTSTQFLEILKPYEVGEDQVASWNYQGTTVDPSSAGGAKIKEASLGALEHIISQFKKFDKDGSGSLQPNEVLKMLRTFNVHMLSQDVGIAMCKFLRDRGMTSPKDPMKAAMQLPQFIEFLHDADDYFIAVPAHWHHPFSQAIPPSRRWDIAAQWFFPVIVGLKVAIFFALLGAYVTDKPLG